MKEYNYDKINDEVFRRADTAKRRRAARNRMLAAVAAPMCCLILVCAVGIPAMNNAKDGHALRGVEYDRQDAEYTGDAIKDDVDRTYDDLSEQASFSDIEADEIQLSLYDCFTDSALSNGGIGYSGILYASVSPTIPELIKESDDIVLVSVEKSESKEKETRCLYELKVLGSCKGALKEGDIFSLSVMENTIRKPGKRMLCFLQEKDGGYSLACGNYGLIDEKIYHEGFRYGRLSFNLEELNELIRRTEEE